MNRYIVKTTCPAHAGLVGTHCSGVILIYIGRLASLSVALATTVILATGCSSAGTGFHAGLISPVSTNQQNANFGDDNWYQPSRSPAFDPDLFGS